MMKRARTTKQKRPAANKACSAPLQPLQALALTAFSAGLCVGSFPRTGLFPLAWVALLPLLHCLGKASAKQAVLLGWLFGALHSLGIAYWVFYAMHVYSNAGLVVSLFFTLGIVGAGIGLYFALFGLIARRLLSSACSPVLQAAGVASAWVLLEYARAHLFTGIPWALLGYSQQPWLQLIQIADIGGVYAVSFLIVFTNALLYGALARRSSRTVALRLAVPAAASILLCLLYGYLRIGTIQTAIAAAQEAPAVAVIQGNIHQDDRWKKDNKDQIVATHTALTRKALADGARLVLWPETTVQYYIQDRLPPELPNLLRAYDARLITGGPRYTGTAGSYTFYNAAYLIDRSGVVATQDKIHLFPFGEYFPLGFIDILKLRYAAPRQYTPGRTFRPFPLPGGAQAGTLLCFEVLFPELLRGFIDQGATMFINLSNDAWFGPTSAHYQHFSMAVFRAIEFRRPLIRAANTGISGHIDATGAVLQQQAPFTEGMLLHRPAPLAVTTLYARFGDIFVVLCLLVLIAALLPNRSLKKNVR